MGFFDIGFIEIIVILVVALLVIGFEFASRGLRVFRGGKRDDKDELTP